MKVAVCIPTYNQSAYLREAINSALMQTWKDLEVWVSDDASTDDTREALETLSASDSRVKPVYQEKNRGIAGNVDDLLRLPKTEFIVRLDSDDILLPDYVETLVGLMLRYEHAGIAHANVQEIDKHGRNTRVRMLRPRPCWQDAEDALRDALSGYRVAANICMFRRSALVNVNYIAGRPEYTEDYDLFVRLADAGFGNLHCDRILSKYRVWLDSAGLRPKRKATELRGLIRIFNEAIGPAFARRGWDHALVQRNRENLALGHSIYLAEQKLDEGNYSSIAGLLRELGSSVKLERKIRWIGCGAGWLFLLRAKLHAISRDFAKQLMCRWPR